MELKVPFFNVTLPLGVPSATLADALLDKVHFIVNSTPEVTIRPDESAGLKTAVWPLPTVTPVSYTHLFRNLELSGIKCTIDYHVQPDGCLLYTSRCV